MPVPHVLTLGNFDGPHVGHLAIVAEARDLARRHGSARVLARDVRPAAGAFATARGRAAAAGFAGPTDRRPAAGGADDVAVLTPTPEMLAQSPEDFIAQLVERYRPIAMVEGGDFRFGKDRRGNLAVLETLGHLHGFRVVTVSPQCVTLRDLQSVPVSSSLVRWLVGHGRVADAATCLGRRFSLTATIARGEQRGRTLGIPTANLDAQDLAPYIIPANGVYAGFATLGPPKPDPTPGGSRSKSTTDPPAAIPAAISIGIKPTFGQTALTVEAHLLDTDFDGYGREITLYFERWIRDQHPFPDLDALRHQLHRDIDQVRRAAEPRRGFSVLSPLIPAPADP